MHKFQIRQHTVYAADSHRQDAVSDLRLILLLLFRRRRVWKEVVQKYCQHKRLKNKSVILLAHGTAKRGKWYIQRGEKGRQLTQAWIDEHDGEAGYIFLLPCNPQNMEIRSRHSLIIHFNRNASLGHLFKGGCIRLYHPQYGYIDNNYYRLHQILGR